MRLITIALMAVALAGMPAELRAADKAEAATFVLTDGRSAEVTTYTDGGVSVDVDGRTLSGAEAVAFLAKNGVRITVQDTGRIVPGPKAVETARFVTGDGKDVTVTTYDDASVVVSTAGDTLTGAPAMRYLSQSGIALRVTDSGHVTAIDVTGGARVAAAPLPASRASSEAKPVEVAKFMTGDRKTVTVTTYDDASVIVSTESALLTDAPAMTYLAQRGIALQSAVDGHITSAEVSQGSKVLVAPLAAARVGTGDVLPAETAKFMTEDKQVVELTTYDDGSMRIDLKEGSMTGEEAVAFLGQHSISLDVGGDGHVSWTAVDNGSKVLIPPLSAALSADVANKAEESAAAEQQASAAKKAAEQKAAEQASESSSDRTAQASAASWTPAAVLPANVATGSSAQVQQAQIDSQGKVGGDPGINEQPISR